MVSEGGSIFPLRLIELPPGIFSPILLFVALETAPAANDKTRAA